MLLLNRAICFSNTGDTPKTVEDLKPLMASNNKDEEKLNDKINRIRKKIIGYEHCEMMEQRPKQKGEELVRIMAVFKIGIIPFTKIQESINKL